MKTTVWKEIYLFISRWTGNKLIYEAAKDVKCI
jgi:hypothetical protein